jgi:hypothetical protein
VALIGWASANGFDANTDNLGAVLIIVAIIAIVILHYLEKDAKL